MRSGGPVSSPLGASPGVRFLMRFVKSGLGARYRCWAHHRVHLQSNSILVHLPRAEGLNKLLGVLYRVKALLGPARFVSQRLREGIDAPRSLPDPTYLYVIIAIARKDQPLA